MISYRGVWLPDGEQHIIVWMHKMGEIVDGRGSYQIDKYRAARAHCRQMRTAVDIGAHCGLWAMQMAKDFDQVVCFEPMAEHRKCLAANLVDRENYVVHACALGEERQTVGMVADDHSSGSARVNGAGDTPMRLLDEFNLSDVDFIKVDCEGYEVHALRGGKDTIYRNRPVIVVEQKKAGKGAVEFLETIGYKCAAALEGDFVMVPDV